jgi:RHS repeat-associated protein
VVSRFVYGASGITPDYMIRGGVEYRILTDGRGSPRLVLNAATGAVAQRVDYDEFGNVLQDTAPGFQPFGFAGGLHDANTGLVHFGARDYDPYTGRWTAPDPLSFAGAQTNLYAYVGNDPVNGIDPTGLTIFNVPLRPAPTPSAPIACIGGIQPGGGISGLPGGFQLGGENHQPYPEDDPFPPALFHLGGAQSSPFELPPGVSIPGFPGLGGFGAGGSSVGVGYYGDQPGALGFGHPVGGVGFGGGGFGGIPGPPQGGGFGGIPGPPQGGGGAPGDQLAPFD